MNEKPYHVPREIAKEMGVGADKVMSWIREKRLRAIDVSSADRPQYRILPEDLEAFRRSIETMPKAKTEKPRRQRRRGKKFV